MHKVVQRATILSGSSVARIVAGIAIVSGGSRRRGCGLRSRYGSGRGRKGDDGQNYFLHHVVNGVSYIRRVRTYDRRQHDEIVDE